MADTQFEMLFRAAKLSALFFSYKYNPLVCTLALEEMQMFLLNLAVAFPQRIHFLEANWLF